MNTDRLILDDWSNDDNKKPPLSIFESSFKVVMNHFSKIYTTILIILGLFALCMFALVLVQQGNCNSICSELAESYESKCLAISSTERSTYGRIINIGKFS
jgi:hypothetical protein